MSCNCVFKACQLFFTYENKVRWRKMHIMRHVCKSLSYGRQTSFWQQEQGERDRMHSVYEMYRCVPEKSAASLERCFNLCFSQKFSYFEQGFSYEILYNSYWSEFHRKFNCGRCFRNLPLTFSLEKSNKTPWFLWYRVVIYRGRWWARVAELADAHV